MTACMLFLGWCILLVRCERVLPALLCSVPGLTDRMISAKAGVSYRRSVSDAKASQIRGFGGRLSTAERENVLSIEKIEAKFQHIGLMVRIDSRRSFLGCELIVCVSLWRCCGAVVGSQIVFVHIWLLLLKASSLAHEAIREVLPAALAVSVIETIMRFLGVAVKRNWKEFL